MNKRTSKKPKKKVLIALSGGIDSAVSAVLLLRAGYEVEAAFMKNWNSTTGLIKNECPWLDDRREALKVAAQLGIPLHTFNFEKEYAKNVMQYFFEEYAAGRTPNPDVMCNKEIKFKLLYDKAIHMGFDYLATGHYAQVKNGRKNSEMLRSKDEFKDQTYFIYNIHTEQLKHLLFPIGGYKKTEVRKLAYKFNLPNADRKESMGICFVGKVQLDKFLQQKIKPKKGNIIDAEDNILGQHDGAAFYTIGQRHGLKISGGPYYVVKKDVKTNTLTVSKNPEDLNLKTKEVEVAKINWITKPKSFPYVCKARFRHQQKLQDVRIESGQKGFYKVKFKHLQHAVAAGQSIVFYKNKTCIGGGVMV